MICTGLLGELIPNVIFPTSVVLLKVLNHTADKTSTDYHAEQSRSGWDERNSGRLMLMMWHGVKVQKCRRW
jgi:hypothetical protein